MSWEDQDAVGYNLTDVSLLRNDDIVNIQRDAPDDLKVISWPPGQDFKCLKGYKYLSRPQRASPKARVIIIDNGYELDGPSRVYFGHKQSWIDC